jgi:fluoride ion exporter CrcB/FEX
MTNAVLIFVAGGCGSVLRYLAGLAVPSALFPWATLGVNAGDSFLCVDLGFIV